MSQTILDVRNIKKYFNTPYGELHAVDNVSFSIDRGKTLGVVGESGCGKSTLGRTLLKLIPPTSGEVWFEGRNILQLPKEEFFSIRKKMQIIFQDPFSSLDPRMTVYQAIAEPLIIHKCFTKKSEMQKKVNTLMDLVGIAERYVNAYPHELDGGRRQRICIARALALDPQFIVCDEPVSALDVSIQAQILNLMMDLRDQFGFTYMFITHDLSVVKHISNEIAVMYLGQMVEKASPEELFTNPMHPYTKALLNAIPVPALGYKDITRNLIKGEVTSPIEPKPGCRFAARCSAVMPRCSERDPEFLSVGSEENKHSVACRLYQE